MKKYYTPREANKALNVIRPIVEELMRIGENIRARQPELWSVAQKSAGNGGNPFLSKALKDFERLDELVHEIQNTGIFIKDLTVGIIDFLALHDGREIYLCWRHGEEQVRFWHEVHAGFAERQLIDWD